MKKIFYIVMLSFSVQVYADNLNKRTSLSPKVRLKVNKHIAKSYIKKKISEQQAEQQSDESLTKVTNNNDNNYQSSNNGQVINSFNNVRQAPKEVITAVRGDIINICFHCR